MRRRTRAPTSSICARTSWPAPTTGSARRASLYEQCLELDPRFAPAWARLGRCHRVIGKYIDGAPDSEARAEEAFRRALALNPRLSIAHKFYANLEADIGQACARSCACWTRPIATATIPSCLPAWCTPAATAACSSESIAAHAEARRLDPNVPTSVEQTLLMAGEIDRLAGDRAAALVRGRRRRHPGHRARSGRPPRRGAPGARRACAAARIPAFQSWTEFLMAWLEDASTDMLRPDDDASTG